MSQRLFGLERNRRHAQALWQMDADYAHKLSEKDRKWLSRFLHEYYLSAPNSAENIHPPELMRERWRAHKRNKLDMATQAEFEGKVALEDGNAHQFDTPNEEAPDHARAVSMAMGVWEARTRRRKAMKAKGKRLTPEEYGRLGGLKRAKRMSKEARKKSAQLAARERWFREKKAWPEIPGSNA